MNREVALMMAGLLALAVLMAPAVPARHRADANISSRAPVMDVVGSVGLVHETILVCREMKMRWLRQYLEDDVPWAARGLVDRVVAMMREARK